MARKPDRRWEKLPENEDELRSRIDDLHRAAKPSKFRGQEVAPMMHTEMHLILEKQLRMPEMSFMRDALQRLLDRGIEPHEARHVLGGAIMEDMWYMLQNQQMYEEGRYRRAIETAVEHCLK